MAWVWGISHANESKARAQPQHGLLDHPRPAEVGQPVRACGIVLDWTSQAASLSGHWRHYSLGTGRILPLALAGFYPWHWRNLVHGTGGIPCMPLAKAPRRCCCFCAVDPCRGKERQQPKKKRLSKLKRVILEERQAREQRREHPQEEQGAPSGAELPPEEPVPESSHEEAESSPQEAQSAQSERQLQKHPQGAQLLSSGTDFPPEGADSPPQETESSPSEAQLAPSQVQAQENPQEPHVCLAGGDVLLEEMKPTPQETESSPQDAQSTQRPPLSETGSEMQAQAQERSLAAQVSHLETERLPSGPEPRLPGTELPSSGTPLLPSEAQPSEDEVQLSGKSSGPPEASLLAPSDGTPLADQEGGRPSEGTGTADARIAWEGGGSGRVADVQVEGGGMDGEEAQGEGTQGESREGEEREGAPAKGAHMEQPQVGGRERGGAPVTYIGVVVKHRYCQQVITRELNEVTAQVLRELHRLQKRAIEREPLKARMRQRMACGLRESARALRAKRARCVLVAPNVEEVPGPGGLDSCVSTILELAREGEVPIVFALTKSKMGQVRFTLNAHPWPRLSSCPASALELARGKRGASCVWAFDQQGGAGHVHFIPSCLDLPCCLPTSCLDFLWATPLSLFLALAAPHL